MLINVPRELPPLKKTVSASLKALLQAARVFHFLKKYPGDLLAILASRVSNSFELCGKQIVSAAILTASSFVDSLHPTSRATL